MYLSRLVLNPRSHQVAQELAEPYEMHRTVLRAFPAHLPADERVLFRVDDAPQFDAPLLLVQSIYEPDWSFLRTERSRVYLHALARSNPAVKAFAPVVRPELTLNFRLRANPTVKRRAEDGRPVRRGILDEAGQRDWLTRKAADAGFCVCQVAVTAEDKETGVIHHDDRTHELTLAAVRFDGVLRVIDSEAFLAALRNGIGSAKGFGFGLLSLARAG